MDSCFYSFYKVPIIVINLNPQRYVREVKYSLLPVKSSLCLNCLNLKQLKTSNFNDYKKKNVFNVIVIYSQNIMFIKMIL